MNIKDLENKLVAVLGFGREGQAIVRYLVKHGIYPVLFDEKPWEEWPSIEQEKIKQLKLNFIFGPDAFLELAGFDVAFRSPGISFRNLSLAFPSKGERKLKITSQTKWFFDNSPAKIIGVTGTKGKGTTATLIAEILCSAPIYRQSKKQPINGHATKSHPNIYLTGNIGKEQPLDIIDNLKKDDWVVYELSSFQLQDLQKSPHIAVVLMITSEHLDYHKDNNEYILAKAAITKFQTEDDFAVINADYPASIKIGKLGQGRENYFSRKKPVTAGCFAEGEKLLISSPPGEEGGGEGRTIEICKIDHIQLRGVHNLENICAAVTAAICAGADLDVIKQTVVHFKGLEHRLQYVGEKHGIKFYNDSFSTTPETAIAAIQSFNEPLIVILGGSKKNSDFTELGETVLKSKNIKALILIGEEAERIKEAIISSVPPLKIRGGEGGLLMLEGAKSMDEIFGQIKSVASSGDAVLLSPACASFDMFKNYNDRGEQFLKMVATL